MSLFKLLFNHNALGHYVGSVMYTVCRAIQPKEHARRENFPQLSETPCNEIPVFFCYTVMSFSNSHHSYQYGSTGQSEHIGSLGGGP